MNPRALFLLTPVTLLLADALALADEERPDLLVDLATLTGAARVALGPELPAAYSPNAARRSTAPEAPPRRGAPALSSSHRVSE